MKTKKCSKCKEIKLLSEFHKKKYGKYRVSSQCKKCIKEINKDYYKNNVSKLRDYYKNNVEKRKECSRKYYRNNREKMKDYGKEYYRNNLEKIKERVKNYYKNNPEKRYKIAQKWWKNNREKARKYASNRMKNPRNKLNNRISIAICRSLKGNKNNRHWQDLIGYTLQELISHLEKQFKNGMNWNNYGKWHIDHRKPISSFSFNSYKNPEFRKCWALENLQPLWALENIIKGDRVDYEKHDK